MARTSTFAVDVAAFSKKAMQNAQLVVRRVVLDVFSRIIKRTPVGNPDLWKSKRAPPGYAGGRLRGNWQTSVSAPKDGELELRTAAEARGETALVAVAWDADGSIFLTNNLPYAQAVEDGHSRVQAPAGMVRVTLTEYPGIVERRAREAKAR